MLKARNDNNNKCPIITHNSDDRRTQRVSIFLFKVRTIQPTKKKQPKKTWQNDEEIADRLTFGVWRLAFGV